MANRLSLFGAVLLAGTSVAAQGPAKDPYDMSVAEYAEYQANTSNGRGPLAAVGAFTAFDQGITTPLGYYIGNVLCAAKNRAPNGQTHYTCTIQVESCAGQTPSSPAEITAANAENASYVYYVGPDGTYAQRMFHTATNNSGVLTAQPNGRVGPFFRLPTGVQPVCPGASNAPPTVDQFTGFQEYAADGRPSGTAYVIDGDVLRFSRAATVSGGGFELGSNFGNAECTGNGSATGPSAITTVFNSSFTPMAVMESFAVGFTNGGRMVTNHTRDGNTCLGPLTVVVEELHSDSFEEPEQQR